MSTITVGLSINYTIAYLLIDELVKMTRDLGYVDIAEMFRGKSRLVVM